VRHDPGISVNLQFSKNQFFLSVSEHPGKKGTIAENNNDKKGKSRPIKKIGRMIELGKHDGQAISKNYTIGCLEKFEFSFKTKEQEN
jgi:hypothetical protein